MARVKEDDESVPYYNGYYYITRFETGKGYPILEKKKVLKQQKKYV
jgi:oligopeptidase B